MRIDVYHHICFGTVAKADEILSRLEALEAQGELIMATQEQLTAQVTAATEKLVKIGTETATLLTRIDELKAVIDSLSEVSPGLQAAVDALTAQAEVVDGLVPDAQPPA